MAISLLYDNLKTKLQTDVPELKHVRLFNSQFENDNEESAFDYPVAFIEFPSIVWNDDSQGLQKGEVQINIHLGFKSLEDEDVDFWTITNKVFSVLNGYAQNTNGLVFEPMKRVAEIQDIDHDNVMVWIQTYETILTDSCDFVFGNNQKATPTSIIIERDLDINSLILRTGDGNFTIKRPTDIDGLLWWLYPLDATTIDVDVLDRVIEARDVSGKGNNFVQPTTSEKPTYVSGQYIDFLDSDLLDSENTIVWGDSNKMTYCGVLELNENLSGANGFLLEISNSTTANNDAFYIQANKTQNQIRVLYRNPDNGDVQNGMTLTPYYGVKTFYTIVIDKDQTDFVDKIKFYVNGVQVTSISIDTGSTQTDNFGDYQHFIGARNGNVAPALMQLHENFVYNVALTDEQIKSLFDNYIKDLHNL